MLKYTLGFYFISHKTLFMLLTKAEMKLQVYLSFHRLGIKRMSFDGFFIDKSHIWRCGHPRFEEHDYVCYDVSLLPCWINAITLGSDNGYTFL